jgi:hypothetical protein
VFDKDDFWRFVAVQNENKTGEISAGNFACGLTPLLMDSSHSLCPNAQQAAHVSFNAEVCANAKNSQRPRTSSYPAAVARSIRVRSLSHHMRLRDRVAGSDRHGFRLAMISGKVHDQLLTVSDHELVFPPNLPERHNHPRASAMPNEEFYRSLSEYLKPVSDPIKLSLPLPLCVQYGKTAAIEGKTEADNPFIASKEPDQHAAWLKGFASGQSTRTLRDDSSILMPPDYETDTPTDDAR